MTDKEFETLVDGVNMVKQGIFSKEYLEKNIIIPMLSNNENIITSLLLLLESERKTKKELILDMNVELSRAHICLEDKKLKGTIPFALSEIEKFYIKWKGKITHCFNRFND
jgi:hypothetical protein